MFDAVNLDDGVHLAFGVIGYEFPDMADDWCLVRVAVWQGAEAFEAVDPALEATELAAIRDWFRALAADRLPRYATLSFTENCLAFEFLARTMPASGSRYTSAGSCGPRSRSGSSLTRMPSGTWSSTSPRIGWRRWRPRRRRRSVDSRRGVLGCNLRTGAAPDSVG